MSGNCDSHIIRRSAYHYLQSYNVSVLPLGLPIGSQMTDEQKVSASKRPSAQWEQYQTSKATVEDAQSWSSRNIGIVTGAVSGIVVVDCESRDDAKWFWTNRGQANVIVKTRRGFHFYFRHPGPHVPNAQKLEDGKYDIRGDGGYVVAPPSVVGDHKYEFITEFRMKKPEEMVPFNLAWRYPAGQQSAPREQKLIRDGVRYIKTIQAIAGQGGHSATFKAAKYLRESGLSEVDAFAAMLEWNQTNCDPPWSQPELLHKVKDAFR